MRLATRDCEEDCCCHLKKGGHGARQGATDGVPPCGSLRGSWRRFHIRCAAQGPAADDAADDLPETRSRYARCWTVGGANEKENFGVLGTLPASDVFGRMNR